MKYLLSRSSLIEPDNKDEQGHTASNYDTHLNSVDLWNTLDQWPGKGPGYVTKIVTKRRNVFTKC